MGRHSNPTGSKSQCKEMRVCGAQGCKVEVRGTDLGKHYKSNTNSELLTELNTLSTEAAETLMTNSADPHTTFMFRNKYSLTDLPTWKTHKKAKKPIPDMFKVCVENVETNSGTDDEDDVDLAKETEDLLDENSNDPPPTKRSRLEEMVSEDEKVDSGSESED